MSIEDGLRRLNRYGIGKLPDPGQPGDPNPHHIGDPDYPGSGPESGDVGDNPYKLDRYWGHPSPGPGLDIDEANRRDAAITHAGPTYLHSPATRALRQSNYDPHEANQIIRLARRGQLTEEAGGFRDPLPAARTYDPTPPTYSTDPSGVFGPHDPIPGDERPMQSTDPGYYLGTSATPGAAGYHGDPAAIRQGLEQIGAHRQVRLDRLARRQAAPPLPVPTAAARRPR